MCYNLHNGVSIYFYLVHIIHVYTLANPEYFGTSGIPKCEHREMMTSIDYDVQSLLYPKISYKDSPEYIFISNIGRILIGSVQRKDECIFTVDTVL